MFLYTRTLNLLYIIISISTIILQRAVTTGPIRTQKPILTNNALNINFGFGSQSTIQKVGFNQGVGNSHNTNKIDQEPLNYKQVGFYSWQKPTECGPNKLGFFFGGKTANAGECVKKELQKQEGQAQAPPKIIFSKPSAVTNNTNNISTQPTDIKTGFTKFWQQNSKVVNQNASAQTNQPQSDTESSIQAVQSGGQTEQLNKAGEKNE